MSSWSKDNLLEFIEEFRNHECVWKVKCKDYHNRDKKEAAYRSLLLVVKVFDKNVTKSDVLKKINNIRSAFRKEQKKVVASQRSGSGTDDIYVPKLWYYRDLLFLIDQEKVLGGTSNLGDGRNSEDEDDLDDVQTEPIDAEGNVTASQSQQIYPQVIQTASNITSPTTEPKRKNAFKRQKTLSPSDQVLLNIGQRLATVKQEDHIDAFGKNVAQKLRFLNNDQRIYVQKVINDALFEAELGGLTRFATVNPGFINSGSTLSTSSSSTTQSIAGTATSDHMYADPLGLGSTYTYL